MKSQHEQQKGEMELDNPRQKVSTETEPVDESRRRFTKSGLAVSGVMLTLASKHSLGGGLVCKSPSGFLSGNLSTHGAPKYCSGCTPGYWATHGGGGPQPNGWPSPYQPGTCSGTQTHYASWSGGTKFNDRQFGFQCNGFGQVYKPYSMMQVLLLSGGGDPNQLGAHIVAALLNAQRGYTPVLTVAQVTDMFNEWDQNGYYEPTAGVKWNGAEIVAYLLTTMS
jgi:hypothetical protein